jgi:homeobox protein ESX1
MALLNATGLDVAGPVLPVVPEFPETATGLLTALENAGPVRPVFVALDCADEFPESPVVAMGVTLTFTPPPAPPFAVPTATLLPPMAADEPMVPNERLRAGPAGPETPTAMPPLPPIPPIAATPVLFTAAPVLPDAALLVALAPELALLLALPTATAGPVFPELPELPDCAPPPMATAVPRIAELVAVGFEVAAPVLPVFPEFPDTATGLLTADEDAGPVFPVLVALDWLLADPESPDVATGLTLTVEPPPEPPFDDVWVTLDPPVAVLVPMVPTDTLVAEPPAPDAPAARPPLPPLPPAEITVVWFTAAPVVPEPDVEPEPAPEEAVLLAPPVATAGPVEPDPPEFPEVWAHDGVDCRSSTAKTAAAEARMAQPSRLMFRMVAIFMRITSLPTQMPGPRR